MGVSKKEVFSEYQNQIASFAKAFAHPARVAIVEYLLKNRTCITKDLTEEFQLSQSTISQHLKELKQVGIIQGTIEAPRVCYCIDETIWAQIKNQFEFLFASLDNNNCC